MPLKPCKIGKNANCVGTTINDTTITNNQSRPGNCIHANAYAAKAAIVIGIIVAGIVTINDDIKALGTFLLSKSTSMYASAPNIGFWLIKTSKFFGFGEVSLENVQVKSPLPLNGCNWDCSL